MQMFPDDLPLANIDADGYCCHFMRSSVRPTIHGLGFVYCIQSAWKKWPTIWHADVSRWLTLSIHGCLWISLLVHLSVCSFTEFFLRLGLGQRRAVVIIGRWLLPSLVDTGDICCHYWQHILVLFDLCLFITIFNFILNYVAIVTFWIFTYHKIWILLIIFCFIWNYWIIYFYTPRNEV